MRAKIMTETLLLIFLVPVALALGLCLVFLLVVAAWKLFKKFFCRKFNELANWQWPDEDY